jgi:hypothetical protein
VPAAAGAQHSSRWLALGGRWAGDSGPPLTRGAAWSAVRRCNGLLLCAIREHDVNDGSDAPLGLKVWSPKHYPADRLDLMPIITPAYPSMNCTYNASETTRQLLREELERAHLIVKDVDKHAAAAAKGAAAAAAAAAGGGGGLPRRRAGSPPIVGWEQLFAPYRLFRDRRYRYFLRIAILAVDADTYRQWFGWVESKLRFLVLKLEQCAPTHHGMAMDEFVRPLSQTFPIQSNSWTEAQQQDIAAAGFDMRGMADSSASAFYMGLRMPSAAAVRGDSKKEPADSGGGAADATSGGTSGNASGEGGGAGAVVGTGDARGGGGGGGGGGRGVGEAELSLDIGPAVAEFSKQLREWPYYHGVTMAAQFQCFRRSELPSDILDFACSSTATTGSPTLPTVTPGKRRPPQHGGASLCSAAPPLAPTPHFIMSACLRRCVIAPL